MSRDTVSWRLRLLPLLFLLLIAAVATSCGGAEPTPVPVSAVSKTLAIQDSASRSIVIERAPQRIVSLSAAHTEILCAIGACNSIVGRGDFSDFPQEVLDKPKLGGLDINKEKLVELQPDFVLIFYQGHLTDLEQLLGEKVFLLEVPETLEGVFDQIRLLGQITGRSEEAERLAQEMTSRIARLEEKLEQVEQGPRVFYELDAALFTISPQTFIGKMLTLLNAQNIAEGSAIPYPQLTAEVAIEKDPEVILLADAEAHGFGKESPETVRARPGWSQVSAVQNNRIYAINPNLVSRPGPRIVEGLEAMARLLYPDLFP